ncbi:MAG: penicillin-binding protein 2 [Fusobacteriaceae bacterium]
MAFKIRNRKRENAEGEFLEAAIIFKGVVFLTFIILIIRLIYLQGYQYEKYKDMSDKNRLKFRRVEPERGKIFDRNGKLLATNGSGYRLIYYKERKYTPEILQEIEYLTGFSKEYIERRIKYGEISPYTRENILIENLDENMAHKILEKLKDDSIVDIQIYSKRRYLYDKFASHVIGYVKKISTKEYENLKEQGYTARDNIGKDGIEKKYDKILKGEPGYEKIEINAYSRLQRKIDKQKSQSGSDIYLTIDFELQDYIEKILETEGMTGSFIAINPKNGEVITLVSYPTYSLNTFSSQIPQEVWDAIKNDPRKPLNNKAIAGEYPPGSIFKPISAFSYLDRGINPKQKYYDPGYYSIGEWKWKAWKVGGHGYVDMEKSIIESANPYYYRFADQFGYTGIHDFAVKFGLGEATGIDIPGEKKGTIPNPEWKKKMFKQPWYKGDTINMAIGQGYVLVTPLQMAQAYTILANGGFAYKPRLLKEVYENGKKAEIELEKSIDISIPKWYYEFMNEALRKTVAENNGTTTILRTAGISIGAKSGSAQNAHSKVTHAWVAGYFPVKEPEIVFVALLEGAGGGGKIAGGLAKKFVDKYYELKKLEQLKNEMGE